MIPSPPERCLVKHLTGHFSRSHLRRGVRKFLLGDPQGRGEEKLEPFTLTSLWLLGRQPYSWRLTQDQKGPWKRTRRGRVGARVHKPPDERRCSCWREIRDLGRSGKQDGPALTQRLPACLPGRPQTNSSPSLLSALCCPPLAPAHALGSPRPPEVTPTALIIFCFAPRLFSTTNFQQSPWRRAGARGGVGAAAVQISGLNRRRANFSGCLGTSLGKVRSPGPALQNREPAAWWSQARGLGPRGPRLPSRVSGTRRARDTRLTLQPSSDT